MCSFTEKDIWCVKIWPCTDVSPELKNRKFTQLPNVWGHQNCNWSYRQSAHDFLRTDKSHVHGQTDCSCYVHKR